ncbi:MAG: rod shape-determining protein MreC [Planctomycetes bacterium]|nr:rod shape-determining protein MreC [Planctomycetota bacterium]
MRRRAERGGKHDHWVLVAVCVGLCALPSTVRAKVRARLLDVRVRISQGIGQQVAAPATPAEAAASQKVQLLEGEVARLKGLLVEGGVASQVLELSRDVDRIPAQAVNLANMSQLRQRLALNRGERDGVRVGLPVLSGDALVGRVAQVGETSCEVSLVTDPGFAVRAEVCRSDGELIHGMLRGSEEGELVFVPALDDPRAPVPLLHPRESVLCSRQSLLCGVPALIGVIDRIDREPGTTLPRAHVLPACDLDALEGLVVVRCRTQRTIEGKR